MKRSRYKQSWTEICTPPAHGTHGADRITLAGNFPVERNPFDHPPAAKYVDA